MAARHRRGVLSHPDPLPSGAGAAVWLIGITQRTFDIVLPMETRGFSQEKQNHIETVGDAIRLAREQAGWTQEGLAKAARPPRYWLGRW